MRRAVVRRLVVASVGANVIHIAVAGAAFADVPATDIVRELLDSSAGWAFEETAGGIAQWILGAVAYFVEGALGLLQSSARPQVEADWFAGPGSPFAAVRNIAAVLLLAFAFLGVLQGLVHGDVATMVRQVVGKLPLAVIGMIATVAAVGKLLDLTDALSAAVLATTDDEALHFLSGFGVAAIGATSGFAAVVLGLVGVIAALILWIELLVRASLVYLLVAVSPLGFAAMIWPSARGFLRKTVELLVAVIVSKFVIAVALSTGVAALAGAGEAAEGAAAGSGGAEAGLGTLLVGSVVVGLAAFAPFIVLKLIPMAEAAIAAHGISRAPVRATQSGASTYSSMSRLAGGHQPGPRSSQRSRAAGAQPGAGATRTVAQGTGATNGAAAGAGVAAGAATAGIAAAASVARHTAGTADRSAEVVAAAPKKRPSPRAPQRAEQRNSE